MIEIEYELFTAGEQNEPVAWTRTDVYAPVVKEEVMLKHPELRQYYPVPLYMAPSNKE